MQICKHSKANKESAMTEQKLVLDAIRSGDLSAETVLRFCLLRMDNDDLVDLCEKFDLYNYDDEEEGVIIDEF